MFVISFFSCQNVTISNEIAHFMLLRFNRKKYKLYEKLRLEQQCYI